MSPAAEARYVADAEARRAAQRDFSRPLVLEAGAGTGKTAVLVSRLVAWCLGRGWERAEERAAAAPGLAGATGSRPTGLGPDPLRVAADVLRRVVAITFTEAAAAEMATRVGAALIALERGQTPPAGIDLESLPADAELRALRARALVATLDQLGVRTIHAWCRRLLTAHPLEAGLHPRFEVDADGRGQREVVREVLEARLAEAYSGDAAADHFSLAVRGLGPPEVEEALVALVEAGVPPAALAEDPFTAAADQALRERLLADLDAFLRVEAGALAGNRRARSNVAAADAIEATRERLRASEGTGSPYAWLQDLRELWMTKLLDTLRKWGRGDFGTTALQRLEGRELELAPLAASLQRRLAHVLTLEPEGFEVARRVLRPLLEQVTDELRSRGVESFDALLQDTRRLLAESSATAARIRRDIDQILVDEFQDTDRTQCEILRTLALQGEVSERPGLFLVGDPKQSIYGWRNADLAAYYDFVEALEADGGCLHRLTVNFRSVPAILEEVACVMRPVMLAEACLQPAFQPLDACPELAEAVGFSEEGFAPVEHWVSWEWDAEAGAPAARTRARDATELEARALAREIAGLNARFGVAWRDVALLFRGFGDQEIYLGALRDAGVPYVVERDRSYYQRREIIEASALVRCLLDPRDHVALLSLLRSAWVGTPDVALIPLWHRQLPEIVSGLGGDEPAGLDEVRRIVEEAAACLPEGVPGIERIPDWPESLIAALEALAVLRRCFEEDPPDLFVERVRTCFGAEATEAARYLAPYRLANLDRFFRDLVAALEDTGGDVGSVLAHLRRAVSEAREAEEGRPRDAAENAVHVLSIHKAKGLDFAHVYLLQAHKGERLEDPKAVRAAQRDGRFEYTLFGMATPGLDALAVDAEAVTAAERVRTLYVAMTRARERLVLCGSRATRPSRGAPKRTHAALLQRREPAPPDLVALMGEAAGAGRDHADVAGARWRFPVLVAAGALAETPGPAEPSPGFDADALERGVAALAEARGAAARRAARPFHGVASREALDPEAALDARYGAESDADGAGLRREALPRSLAQAAGTALHAALEFLDPTQTPDALRASCEERIESVLALHVGPDELAPARQRAGLLLERFLAGPLLAQLERLAPHVIGRELPVLAPPPAGPDGPLGFVAGAIDLLYRDPESGELVVADYKTDAVKDESVIHERVASYARQGQVYAEAVQSALGLPRPPRFELWFLDAGRIERVGL